MITTQRFIRRKIILAFSLCVGVGLAASNTYAGFEWVPQKKVAPVAPVVELPPPASAEPVPVDDIVLPLPSDKALNEPVMVTPPAAAMEKKSSEDAMPTRIAIIPKEEPDSGVVINKPVEPSLPPLDVAVTPETMPKESPEMLKKPPMARGSMSIIVPDDAPESALQNIKNGTTITAYPSQSDLAATQAIAMPSINGGRVVLPADHNNEAPVVVISEFAEAVGFAKDVPLALALRQVVPADYAFSFENGVNPGLRVSWNGGKPWNEVVSDMAVALGYGVVITQKSVRITQQQQSETVVTPNLVEPAAGNENAKESIAEIKRERDIKRIGISDPGFAESDTPAPHSSIIIEETSNDVTEDQTLASLETPNIVEPTAITPSKISFWTAESGASLKETLTQWSNAANIDLIWDAAHDFQLPADFEVQGSFEKAVDLLLKHGLEGQNAAFSHSLATSSQNEQAQIIIQNAG